MPGRRQKLWNFQKEQLVALGLLGGEAISDTALLQEPALTPGTSQSTERYLRRINRRYEPAYLEGGLP